MTQTWTKEEWQDRQIFLLSKEWLESILTSFYLFLEDPDVQVTVLVHIVRINLEFQVLKFDSKQQAIYLDSEKSIIIHFNKTRELCNLYFHEIEKNEPAECNKNDPLIRARQTI